MMENTIVSGPPTNQSIRSSSCGPTPPPRPAAEVQFNYHQILEKYTWIWNNRPKDNNMNFWRRFVSEFYTRGSSKKKLCLMAYKDNPATMMKINRFLRDKSACWHCRQNSEHGYEISFEEMPLYFQNKFTSLDDERLHLGNPKQYQLKNGAILLHYQEVFEEATRKYARTIRRGPLAIVFSPHHKKIMSWQFCMHHSEQLVSSLSLHSKLHRILQIASEPTSGQACSQEMQETRKMIIRNMCEMTKHLNMNQFDQLGLSVNDFRTFMVSNSLNDMKGEMNSRIQGNMGPKESLHNNNGPAAANLKVQNNHTAGNNLLINTDNKPVSANLTPDEKNHCPSMMSPDLGNRNINQQVNMQLPPLLNPANLRGTSSTNSQSMTENTLSAGKNGVPSRTTDNLAGAPNIAPPKNSNPSPNPLKRPFPENNLGMIPQQGHMTRQKLGEATSNGRVGYENGKMGGFDQTNLRPIQSITGPSPSLERGKEDCNNKGKGIMQEAENRHLLVKRDMRPDPQIQMPSNGVSGMSTQQGRMTRQKIGEATSNGRDGSGNGKVGVYDQIERRPSQPITGPPPSLQRGKDDCNNRGKGVMQETENRHLLVEGDVRPDATIQMPSNGMQGMKSDLNSAGDGNQLTEELMGDDINIDSILKDFIADSYFADTNNVESFVTDDMSIYDDLEDLE